MKLSEVQMKLNKVQVIIFPSGAVVVLFLLGLVTCCRSIEAGTSYTGYFKTIKILIMNIRSHTFRIV